MPTLVHSNPVPSLRVPRMSRFAWMMALYAENHQRLRRLFAPEDLVAGAYVSRGEDGLDLRMEVVEQHPYTVELRLAYEQLRDDVTGHPDPSAWVRYYRDARQAEVTHCHLGRRWQDVLGLHPPLAELVDHRTRMNVFFNKWLEYLADQGHARTGLRCADAVASDG